MPDVREDQEEIEKIARQVVAGADTIEVPTELLKEEPEAPPKEPDSPVMLSLYAQIQGMTVAQRVKLALKGNKDARSILIRNANRMVQRMVLQNPRITEDEILGLAKNRNSDEEVLRVIADSREFTSSYPVRSALVENSKTPIGQSLRLLKTLADRDIRALAKSKNVPSVIATQARKIMFAKEKTRH
jgi:hypothetical protein